MKTKKIIFLLTFLAFVITSCKKDYPDDIPQWLKDKITHCKRTRDCCEYTGAGLVITEYKNGSGDIQYEFLYSQSTTYYDYTGNILCTYSYPGNSTCTNNMFIGYVPSRVIWQEDEKKCNQ